MMSSRLAAALARRRVHYGWMIAGVTFLTMLVTAGAVGAPSVLILPLQKEFGWQNAEISVTRRLHRMATTMRSDRFYRDRHR